jgi:hypothetical protein
MANGNGAGGPGGIGSARRRAGWRGGSAEALETRVCPSNMVWVNRGQASDNFGTVFGANAEAARRVVDAVLNSWGTVLVNLNQPPVNGSPDRNTIRFTVSMDVGREGFGGGANITEYAYPSEEDRDANRNGYPVAGTITLDRGTNGTPNNGFWIDPTPTEHSEYTDILSPAAARPGPLVVGTDIYSTINAEIVHILGLFGPPAKLQNPANNSTVTRLATRDPQGNGSGFYYVFDGPSATHLLTSYDSGGGGTDTGSATHTAAADVGNQPVAFTSAFRGAVQLRGSIDAGNATGGDTRVLASDNVANLLKDAFGYTVQLPSTIPGFTYNVGMTGRTLRVNGGPDGNGVAMTTAAPPHSHGSAGTAQEEGHTHHGPGPNFVDDGGNSADQISLRREGDDLVVSFLLGRSGPVANFDAHDGGDLAFETRVPLSSFDEIVINDGAGDDDLEYDFSGGEFLPSDGISENGGDGTDRVRVKLGTGATQGQAFVYRSTSTTSGVVTLLPPPGSPPGTVPETIELDSVSSVVLEGDPNNTAGHTLFVDELVLTTEPTPPSVLATRLPVTQQGFQSVTILTSNPVPLLRAYNPTADAHFFTTTTAEFANAVANGYLDESTNQASGFAVSPQFAPDAVPVFRLYNLQSGLHYLTTSAGERDQLVGLIPPTHPQFGKVGWRAETTEGFVFPTSKPGTVEVFHLYNETNGAHLYTANAGELVSVLSRFPNIWKLQRSLGFAYASGFRVTPLAAPSAMGAVAEEAPPSAESATGTGNVASLVAIPALSRAASPGAPVAASVAEEPTAHRSVADADEEFDLLAGVFAGGLDDVLWG